MGVTKSFGKLFTIPTFPCHLGNWVQGAMAYLEQYMRKFCPIFNGVLLNVENIKIANPTATFTTDYPYLSLVKFKMDVTIFNLNDDDKLEGRVVTLRPSWIICLVHEYLTVFIERPKCTTTDSDSTDSYLQRLNSLKKNDNVLVQIVSNFDSQQSKDRRFKIEDESLCFIGRIVTILPKFNKTKLKLNAPKIVPQNVYNGIELTEQSATSLKREDVHKSTVDPIDDSFHPDSFLAPFQLTPKQRNSRKKSKTDSPANGVNSGNGTNNSEALLQRIAKSLQGDDSAGNHDDTFSLTPSEAAGESVAFYSSESDLFDLSSESHIKELSTQKRAKKKSTQLSKEDSNSSQKKRHKAKLEVVYGEPVALLVEPTEESVFFDEPLLSTARKEKSLRRRSKLGNVDQMDLLAAPMSDIPEALRLLYPPTATIKSESQILGGVGVPSCANPSIGKTARLKSEKRKVLSVENDEASICSSLEDSWLLAKKSRCL